MTNNEFLVEMADWFEGISNRTIEPVRPDLGLCSNSDHYATKIGANNSQMEKLDNILDKLFRRFSGNLLYPFGGGDVYESKLPKYDPSDEYGKMRLDCAMEIATALRLEIRSYDDN